MPTFTQLKETIERETAEHLNEIKTRLEQQNRGISDGTERNSRTGNVGTLGGYGVTSDDKRLVSNFGDAYHSRSV